MTSRFGHTTISSDRLYWAVVDCSKAPRGRARRQYIGSQFERVIPVSIDRVHWVSLPLAEKHYLVCGLEIDAMRDLVESLDDRTCACTPTEIPDGCGINEEQTRRLNLRRLDLLVGPFIPYRRLRLRRRVRWAQRVGAGAFMALLIIGIERRGVWAQSEVEHATTLAHVLALENLPASAQGPPSLLLGQLDAEIERTAALHRVAEDHSAFEADACLATVLDALHSFDNLELQEVSVARGVARIVATIPEHDAATAVWQALDELPLSVAAPPRMGSLAGGSIRLVAELDFVGPPG